MFENDFRIDSDQISLVQQVSNNHI